MVFVAQLQWLSGKFHEVRGVMHQFLCQQSIAVCNHAAGLVIIPNNWLQPWCLNTSSGWSVRDLYLCCHFKGFDELMKAWESCLKHMVPSFRILDLIKIIRFTKTVKHNSYIWNVFFYKTKILWYMYAKTFLAYDVSNYKVFFCATNCSFAIINYVAHLTNLSGYFFLLPIHFMT